MDYGIIKTQLDNAFNKNLILLVYNNRYLMQVTDYIKKNIQNQEVYVFCYDWLAFISYNHLLADMETNKRKNVHLIQNGMGMKENMNFNYIVGNPPYLQNMHIKISIKCIENLAPGGVYDFIQPINGCMINSNKPDAPKQKFQELLNTLETKIEIIDDCFGISANTHLVRVIIKNTPGNLSIQFRNQSKHETSLDGLNLLEKDPIIFASIREKYKKYCKDNQSLAQLNVEGTKSLVYGYHISYSSSGWDDGPSGKYYNFIQATRTLAPEEEGCKLIIRKEEFPGMTKYLKSDLARFGLVLEKTSIKIPISLRSTPQVDFMNFDEQQIFIDMKITPEEQEFIHNIFENFSLQDWEESKNNV